MTLTLTDPRNGPIELDPAWIDAWIPAKVRAWDRFIDGSLVLTGKGRWVAVRETPAEIEELIGV